jgi:hypothetical protein
METAQLKQEKAKFQGKKGLKALQARFDELEAGARGRLLKALGAGQHRLTELDGALEKWAREDWSVEGMRRRFEGLRKQADELRLTALKRVNEIPGTAVKGIASSTRVPVQNLARELDRLARLVEPRTVSVTPAQEVEVIPPPEPRPARAPKAKAEV